MNRIELEGVLAHELSHIHNYDILVATIAVIPVGSLALLADFGLRLLLFAGVGTRRGNDGGTQIYIPALAIVFIVVAPIAARAMQFAISRRRESLRRCVRRTRHPQPPRAHLGTRATPDNPAMIAHALAAIAHLEQAGDVGAPRADGSVVEFPPSRLRPRQEHD